MTSAQSTVELLTQDLETDGIVAIEGPMVPESLGAAMKWLDQDEPERDAGLAYRCKFFLYDEHGQPRPETVTPFYVRDYHMDGSSPSAVAVELAGQRIAARLGETNA